MLRVTSAFSPGFGALRAVSGVHDAEGEYGIGPGVARMAAMFGFIAAANVSGWVIFVWRVQGPAVLTI
jgi:hypothetical protein